MSPTIELLYHYIVGIPNPELWPEELRDNPIAGHGQYAFGRGLRPVSYKHLTLPTILRV